MKYVFCYIGFLFSSVLSAWAVYHYLPNHRTFLLEEDGLVENLSAFFLLLSFVVALVFAIKRKEKRRALLVVSAVGLLGFLDETSYGERLFHLSMPFVEGVKLDSLHDLYELMYFQFIKVVPAYTIIAYVLLTLLGVGVLLLLVVRRARLWRSSTAPISGSYMLMLLVGLFTVAALLADFLGSSSVRGFTLPSLTEGTLLEELLEMNIGVGLLFCALSLYDLDLHGEAWTRDRLGTFQLWTGATTLTLLVLGVGVITWYQGGYGQDMHTLAWDSGAETPQSWEYHYLQGNLFSGRGELEEAIDSYRKALKLKPGNPVVSFELGNALMIADDPNEAEVHFRQALSARPDFAEAYLHLGKVLSGRGELAEAIEQFRAALRVQPEFSEAHESLALALTKHGKPDEALKHYEQAVRIMKARGGTSEPH